MSVQEELQWEVPTAETIQPAREYVAITKADQPMTLSGEGVLQSLGAIRAVAMLLTGRPVMKPKIYTELEQGTPEWLSARCGVLTASEIGVLITKTGKIASGDKVQKLQLETIISQSVPSEYMAQIQTGLLVSGREWLDFISFPACGGGKMMVLRVLPDKDYAERILEAVQEAEAQIGEIIKNYQEVIVGNKAQFFDTERRDYDALDDVVELIDA